MTSSARRHIALGALLLALAAGQEVHAQTPSSRAIQLFREANLHYNAGQLQLAADKYLAAIKADPSIPGPYRNLGLTFRAMGRCDLALPYYQRYLVMQPKGRLSPRVSEEIRHCQEKVGTSSPAPLGPAQVLIRASESGAQVKIDGVSRGSTPTGSLPVQPGRHVVVLEKDGYLPWTGVVEVAEGLVVEVVVVLVRDPRALSSLPAPGEAFGKLRLLGLPSRASAMMNRSIGLAASGETRVPVGTHEVEVSMWGTLPWRQRVTIEKDRTTTLMPVLTVTPAVRTARKVGWASVGLAAVLGISGGVLGLLEGRTYEQIVSHDRTQGTRAELRDLMDTRQKQAVAANVLYGVAAASLVTGVVILISTPHLKAPVQKPAGGMVF